MKNRYIFIGTEQDLVDAGFDETEIAFFPHTGKVSMRWRREIKGEKEHREILINMQTKSIRVMDFNRDFTYPVREEFIKDLIDRGLIQEVCYEKNLI